MIGIPGLIRYYFLKQSEFESFEIKKQSNTKGLKCNLSMNWDKI